MFGLKFGMQGLTENLRNSKKKLPKNVGDIDPKSIIKKGWNLNQITKLS